MDQFQGMQKADGVCPCYDGEDGGYIKNPKNPTPASIPIRQKNTHLIGS